MFQAEDRHTPAAALPVPVVGFKLLRQINRTEVKRSGANGTPLTCITDSALCPRMHSPRLVLVLRTHTCQPLSGPGRFPGTYLPACLPSARVSPSRSLPVGAVRVLLVGRDLFSGQKMPLVVCSALRISPPNPTVACRPALAFKKKRLHLSRSSSRRCSAPVRMERVVVRFVYAPASRGIRFDALPGHDRCTSL
jgi:hypothetical protein